MSLSRDKILDSCTNVQWMMPNDCAPIAELYRVLSGGATGRDKEVYKRLAEMFEAKSNERNRQMKNSVLNAWDIAVLGFRDAMPERFASFDSFWSRDDYFTDTYKRPATKIETSAFETLENNGLRLPAFVANGE